MVMETTLRFDIVTWPESKKQVVMLECTVTWEDWMKEANERKKTWKWDVGVLQAGPSAKW